MDGYVGLFRLEGEETGANVLRNSSLNYVGDIRPFYSRSTWMNVESGVRATAIYDGSSSNNVLQMRRLRSDNTTVYVQQIAQLSTKLLRDTYFSLGFEMIADSLTYLNGISVLLFAWNENMLLNPSTGVSDTGWSTTCVKSIVTVSYSNGYVTVTTAVAHGLSAGMRIGIDEVEGMTVLNGLHTVYDCPTTTTFRIALTTNQEYDSGGNVSRIRVLYKYRNTSLPDGLGTPVATDFGSGYSSKKFEGILIPAGTKYLGLEIRMSSSYASGDSTSVSVFIDKIMLNEGVKCGTWKPHTEDSIEDREIGKMAYIVSQLFEIDDSTGKVKIKKNVYAPDGTTKLIDAINSVCRSNGGSSTVTQINATDTTDLYKPYNVAS